MRAERVRRVAAISGLALLLLAVAGVAALLVLRVRPQPAASDGGRAMGTVGGPDLSGMRTYESRDLGLRFRYPGHWRLTENGASREPEGDYLTISLLAPSGTGTAPRGPILLEVVPDPQGFTAQDIANMKWGSAPDTLTVTTETLAVAGRAAVGVSVSETRPRRKSLYTYEILAVLRGRMVRVAFSSSDASDLAAMRTELRRLAGSIEAY